MTTQKRNSGLVDILSVDFQKRYEANFAAGNAVSLLRMIPGLRGAWIAGTFDENYDITDLSDQGRTLFSVGAPSFAYDGLVPWVYLDGTNDWFIRPDEAGLDITGTESQIDIVARGLTIGCWLNFTSVAGFDIIFGKWVAANDLSYTLWRNGTSLLFSVTSGGTGATQVNVTSSVTLAVNQWYFVCGAFDPSTQMDIYVNGVRDTQAVGVPASIFSGAGSFAFGTTPGTPGFEFNGYFSIGFLSAMYLQETNITVLYQQTRAMYELTFTAPALLLEGGDFVLLEDGGMILLE